MVLHDLEKGTDSTRTFFFSAVQIRSSPSLVNKRYSSYPEALSNQSIDHTHRMRRN